MKEEGDTVTFTGRAQNVSDVPAWRLPHGKRGKTSYEVALDAKLDALKAASIVLLEVARAKVGRCQDVKSLIDKQSAKINEAWKEEE